MTKGDNTFWTIIGGMSIGAVIVLALFAIALHGKEMIDESENGSTFIILNVGHCSDNEYTDNCWVHKHEFDVFKSEGEFMSAMPFPNKWLVLR